MPEHLPEAGGLAIQKLKDLLHTHTRTRTTLLFAGAAHRAGPDSMLILCECV